MLLAHLFPQTLMFMYKFKHTEQEKKSRGMPCYSLPFQAAGPYLWR
jgi:hypothetical protein